jgi:hypothetical protein
MRWHRFPIAPGGQLEYEAFSGRGALLVTNHNTYVQNAQRLKTFKQYMLANYRDWLAFAHREGHDVSLFDLIFVTGVDLTRDFAMAAFSAGAQNLNLRFQAGVPQVASASAFAWGAWQTSSSVHHNCGPQNTIPPSSPNTVRTLGHVLPTNLESTDPRLVYDQCVFLRGFRVKERFFVPKILKAGAGSSRLPPSNGKGGRTVGGITETEIADNDHDTDIVRDPNPMVRQGYCMSGWC